MSETLDGMEVRFGCNPTPASLPLLHLGLYLDRGALPPIQHKDWTPGITFPMMRNDELGDCVVAMKGHAVQIFSMLGLGQMATPGDKEIVDTYFKETGGPDSGLDIGTSLGYWVRNPLAGHALSAFAAIDFSSTDQIVTSNQLFGGVFTGVLLPDDAIPAVQKGMPWTNTWLAPNRQKGHAILLAKTESDGPTFITWGRKVKASWAWVARYAVNMFVGLSPDWFQGTSLDPSGLDDATLVTDYQLLTGERPNVVVTPPAPKPPGPGPAPVVGAPVGCVLTIPGHPKKLQATGWKYVD